MKIKFCGAARSVTGSSHLVSLESGYKILLDCGMFQGEDNEREINSQFLFEPGQIDCLILSHAHIDHSGRIPLLVKRGFKGKIICTSATTDLSAIMLRDSAYIQERDTQYQNKKRAKKKLPPVEPLFTIADVEKCLSQFVSVGYDEKVMVNENATVVIRDNGHILGSGSVTLTINENDRNIKLAFTGDIGRPNRPILKNPLQLDSDIDFLICESTYGGRIHEHFPDDANHLLKIINDTCINKKGKIIIPAFSIGRTQEIVYMLDKLYQTHNIVPVPVFVDSPLSTNATQIYREHPECFDEEINSYLKTDANPFGFNSLEYITEVEQSKMLNARQGPAIIIAASGMAEAGRVVHHIYNNAGDARNTILMVGYCAEGTLGARIRKGEKTLRLFGDDIKVKANVELMDSFSAHGDQKEMLWFIDNLDRQVLKKIFLVHGEWDDAQIPFKKALEENRFRDVQVPQLGDEVVI